MVLPRIGNCGCRYPSNDRFGVKDCHPGVVVVVFFEPPHMHNGFILAAGFRGNAGRWAFCVSYTYNSKTEEKQWQKLRYWHVNYLVHRK
jgi:hypothetical protein